MGAPFTMGCRNRVTPIDIFSDIYTSFIKFNDNYKHIYKDGISFNCVQLLFTVRMTININCKIYIYIYMYMELLEIKTLNNSSKILFK